MAKRHNHYEAAFEAYLRSERIAYVAVDERRRALAPGGSLKSVDFIVSGDDDSRIGGYPDWHSGTRPGTQPEVASSWLIDVKGRQFPSGQRHPQYWRNWTTRDELDSLRRWANQFGSRFEALLLFAYELTADRSPVSAERVFYHAQRPYAFVAVRAAAYASEARTLSPKWDTVSVPVARFRELAIPADKLFTAPQYA